MVHHVKSMGASTAGVLSFKSISYNQNLVFSKACFPLLLTILTCFMGFMAFQGYSFWSMGMVLKRTEMFVFVVGLYARSPRIRLANRMSFGMMVTRLAWMAHRLASSNNLTRYASVASWRHSIATDWNRRSVL